MVRRPLRIATTEQLERSAREAGYDVYLLPALPSLDFNRSIQDRSSDGPIVRDFLESNDIELVIDFNTGALTFVPSMNDAAKTAITTSDLGIPYAAFYLDPITSTMANVHWADHWHVLENPTWVKCIPDRAHAEELRRLGVPQVVDMPMGASNDDFDTSPPSAPDAGPAVAFMGHPASSWFRSNQPILPARLFAGLTAAATHADMPDVPFHKMYYDLHEFASPPVADDDRGARATKALSYFNEKFLFNAYLAVKQRDRFARFLKLKLGDAFELVGDHWQTNYGLSHTPRIWDMKLLHDRMRHVPISLNLTKGNFESGLNIRHFEITAYGGFMLTYAMPETNELFVPGEECDVFTSEEDLLQKISFYLQNPARRREIAAAGQRRTLREHLYSHRIERLVAILRQSGLLARLGPVEASIKGSATVRTAPLRGFPVAVPAGVAP